MTTKWAAVTGASRGIGRATALALAEAGWNVAIHHRDSDQQAREVAQMVSNLGRQCHVYQADLLDPKAGARLAEQVFGSVGYVDAWIHNAGADLLTGPAAKASFEEKLERATRVDLWGTILTCKAVGAMMRSTGGSIVTIGWDQSASGMEGDSGELFAAIKGGIAAFTRSLSKSLAPKVRVNCVAPGWIKTAWGESASQAWQDRAIREAPLGRWGTPDDVARMIVFLVGEQACFLTGQTFNVNGGAVTS